MIDYLLGLVHEGKLKYEYAMWCHSTLIGLQLIFLTCSLIWRILLYEAWRQKWWITLICMQDGADSVRWVQLGSGEGPGKTWKPAKASYEVLRWKIRGAIGIIKVSLPLMCTFLQLVMSNVWQSDLGVLWRKKGRAVLMLDSCPSEFIDLSLQWTNEGAKWVNYHEIAYTWVVR